MTHPPAGNSRSLSMKIVHVVSSPLGVRVMLGGQLRFLRESGFEVTVVSSPGNDLREVAAADEVRSAAVVIDREIAPWRDLAALGRLWRLMRRVRPTIAHVGTPKAGLLGGLAAWLAGVPCRVYTLHGLRLETACGLKRRLLIACERVACALAHRVVCVSSSLRRRAIELGLVDSGKAIVLASGSANGVNLSRFYPTRKRLAAASETRRALGIPLRAPVVGFVGRLTRDKGIVELVEAYSELKRSFAELRLLLVGSFEQGDPLPPSVRRAIEEDPRIVCANFVEDTSIYYHMMNVLALPSYREGFPTVALEASAAEKPIVAAAVTGTLDAVVNGATGILVRVGSWKALTEALASVLEERTRAEAMGRAGRKRVEQEFSSVRVWSALLDCYRELLSARKTSIFLARGQRFAQSPLKRMVDTVGSLVMLSLLSPVLVLVGLAVGFTLGRPVLFRQQRVGLANKPFTMLKFRTMTAERGADGRLLPDSERLTALGKILRQLSLDELPQLWNVLKGDMSFVGPRPLVTDYMTRYTPSQKRRHCVKPGITGWAQVHGRNDISWARKFELDAWYVAHASLRLDLRILAATIWQAVRCVGAGREGNITAPEFLGRAESTSE